MNKTSKIYVAGHTGMVGSAIRKKLESDGYSNLIYENSKSLDLRNQQAVSAFFQQHKPEYVFLAAAKVGGILANSIYKADFIYDNLLIQLNIINSAKLNDVNKLLFLGSSCIYPKNSPQPIKEEYLLSGKLEETNEPYAIAKIAGIKMCQSYNFQYDTNFISVMPTNLYGDNDNYDLENSHVLPALIRKFHEAKKLNSDSVTIWGTGAPMREFLHVTDLADACIFLMNSYNDSEIVNIGSGDEISIINLAKTIAKIVGFSGEIKTDLSKPDGTMRKLIDTAKIRRLGWNPKIELNEGIAMVYKELVSEVWF